jgi:uncharacterized protein (DUF488 family)
VNGRLAVDDVERVDNDAPALFTIGYEGRTGAQVVEMLRAAAVTVLVDVRAVPMSRKPDFRKKAWAAMLEAAQIRYYGCAAVGTPKVLRDRLAIDRNYDTFFRDYRRHLRSQYEPMYDLQALLDSERIALMCFEADAATCHRSVIAERLGKSAGLRPLHLGSPVSANGAAARAR